MSANHEKVEALFHEALKFSPAERTAFLAGACGGDAELRQQLEALLKAEAGAGAFLPENPQEAVTIRQDGPAAVPAEEEALGSRISHYKLLQRVGEGGCGVVYMAEQEEPIRRRVALKVIKLGMDTKSVVARFEAERQALALMDHPNIARVLDAGATAKGRPFFVMELVRGIKLTDYCDQNHLSTEARLELFITICQAVQHAHQKGIIHRDLKPSNILVTMHDGVPVPKVIDFGIAKATEQKLTEKTLFTELHQFIGTPAYMSPEQAELTGLDIDTRSDIYSLGVLLYELLTGRTPFDVRALIQEGLDAIRRTIREVEPPRPSTKLSTLAAADLDTVAKARGTPSKHLQVQISGDLDWIVMKALEKDRTRRYETASDFAQDLRRHLTDEPVTARAPSPGYKFWKFARRNKPALAAAAAVAMALLLGLAGSLWQARRARVEAARAQAAERNAQAKASAEKVAREDAEAITRLLTEVFQSPDPARDGRTVTVAESLSRSVERLEALLAGQPERLATMQTTLGETYYGLGLSREAIALQEKALAWWRQARGADHPQTLRVSAALAATLHHAGRYAEAKRLREEVLSRCRQSLGPEHPETILAMEGLARSLHAAKTGAAFSTDPGEVLSTEADLELSLREEVLRLRLQQSGPEHPETITALHHLASSYLAAGRTNDALRLRQDVLARREKILGPAHPETLRAAGNLATSLVAAGRLAEACQVEEAALGRARKTLGPEHPETLWLMINLGQDYLNAGRPDESAALREQLLKLLPAVFGPDHHLTQQNLASLGYFRLQQGQRAEGIRLLEPVLAYLRTPAGQNFVWRAQILPALAGAYRGAGRASEAHALEAEFGINANGVAPAPPPPSSPESVPAPMRGSLASLAALDRESAINPADTSGAMHLAALQVWYGLATEFEATRQRLLLWAAGTTSAAMAERVAKLASFSPSPDASIAARATALARQAVASGRASPDLPWYQMALGMAEFRAGNLAEAGRALLAARQGAAGISDLADRMRVACTADFYRAMNLYQQGQAAEARQLFATTEAAMKPLPAKPLEGIAIDAEPDDLILWLTHQQARQQLWPGAESPVSSSLRPAPSRSTNRSVQNQATK